MKKLEDYTNEELVKLTDLEVDNLIDVECMRAGVSLSIMPKPVLKEIPEVASPTTEIYTVDSYSFTDKSEADELAALLSATTSRVTTDYNYNVGSQYRYYKKYETTTSVKKSLYYSKEEYDDLSNALKTNKEIKEYNDEILKEYTDARSERRDTVDMVLAAINEARNEMRNINEALDV